MKRVHVFTSDLRDEARRELVRARVLISGFVQGIGFRHGTKKKAEELGLAGWVRNCPNDMVEVVAEGPKEKLEKLIEWCRQGPMLAEVKDINIQWQEGTGEFISFEVR